MMMTPPRPPPGAGQGRCARPLARPGGVWEIIIIATIGIIRIVIVAAIAIIVVLINTVNNLTVIIATNTITITILVNNLITIVTVIIIKTRAPPVLLAKRA